MLQELHEVFETFWVSRRALRKLVCGHLPALVLPPALVVASSSQVASRWLSCLHSRDPREGVSAASCATTPMCSCIASSEGCTVLLRAVAGPHVKSPKAAAGSTVCLECNGFAFCVPVRLGHINVPSTLQPCSTKEGHPSLCSYLNILQRMGQAEAISVASAHLLACACWHSMHGANRST